MGKWSYLSPQRIKQINDYGSFLTIELFGAIGEEIEFTTGRFSENEEIQIEVQSIKFDRSQKKMLYFYE
ncbi:Oidioi.mRNA.OKI2018_I69.chr1.g671.t1.cds [Oikopleura dioica]|uniref:Oidioi.mRNA.OKI2018_I69.chr1.g671.t1.cds n=1 Tax=Oikopleura dioica TaxID=34765 RepID=A0ABN7SPT3_OIKDI|nr:Oidioi.mRNA.OKI2018_I69.chr1.g671.t1.cds [Oikopleura dioica]